MPQTKDGEGIWSYIRRRWQAAGGEAAGFVDGHKVEASIGVDVNAAEGLIVQLKGERQRHDRIAVVTMIARVGRPRHDRLGSIGYRVIANSVANDRRGGGRCV